MVMVKGKRVRDMEVNSYFTKPHDILMHVAALKKLAVADGVFSSEEKAFIAAITEGYSRSIGADAIEGIKNDSETITMDEVNAWLPALADCRSSALNFVKDLISLGYADGRYSDAEHNFVKDVAAKIGIDLKSIVSIEKAIVGVIIAVDGLKKCMQELAQL